MRAGSLLAQTPTLQTEAGDDFGDGAFEWGDMVTVHGVRNLGEGLSAKVIAYDVDESLYAAPRGLQEPRAQAPPEKPGT